MGVFGEQISNSEQQVSKILISIISLFGENGLPVDQVESEYIKATGQSIPWEDFGSESLKSWLITLPYIYHVLNRFNEEVYITQSPKSTHITELIRNQKKITNYPAQMRMNGFGLKRKNFYYQDNTDDRPYKMKKRLECENLPAGSFVHTSINNLSGSSSPNRYGKFEELESMLPLFYKHQALGDDFFVDIADTKLGYYVPANGPKETGLCAVGQTIAELTEKVRKAVNLAPRVVVMIGFKDLCNNQNVSSMMIDLKHLIQELKKKSTRVTLVTLIPSPKLPESQVYETRRDIFNRIIWSYASDDRLQCNVIDMNTIFMKEANNFRRDFDRFTRVAKNDPYKVFSDYGRKIFLNALKSCLKQQIEHGY
ncbi:uncharacterized protein LOC126748716 [Anthonomus grandis grandis]|uniref:uncharacterized protein LOC126748716 n=1 Tax=Anthonomus grandis grandis TaxID=2921223 RepID=UPI00216532AE|nr:uncharacterized protein LOC126748716 [Anthonomus grandis grandis]